MRIITSGTSHGDITYCRHQSASLVETGKRDYLVDAGETVTASIMAARGGLHDLRAVFITHMHGDHVTGLPGLISRLVKLAESHRPVRILVPERRAVKRLGKWLRLLRAKWPSPKATLEVYAPGMIFDDGGLRVTAVATRHLKHKGKPCSHAFLLEAEGKRVVFTGDLSADFSDFPVALFNQPVDLCVCEITHFPVRACLPVLAEMSLRRLVLNHVADAHHGEEAEAALAKAMSVLPYPVAIAHDGDVFEV